MSLCLYDLRGRVVETLMDGWQEAGEHRAAINGSQLPAGIYLLRMTAGRQTAISKVCLVK